MVELITIALVLFASILSAIGSLFLKKGSKKLSKNILKVLKNEMILIGMIIYAVSVPPYLIALKRAELSVLYPLVSTTYIWSSLLAVYFLKEKMNRFKWIGIFLIIIGVMFIGIGA